MSPFLSLSLSLSLSLLYLEVAIDERTILTIDANALLPALGKDPPDALHEREIQCLVVVLEVNPTANRRDIRVFSHFFLFSSSSLFSRLLLSSSLFFFTFSLFPVLPFSLPPFFLPNAIDSSLPLLRVSHHNGPALFVVLINAHLQNIFLGLRAT
jgi:hypothetical protein